MSTNLFDAGAETSLVGGLLMDGGTHFEDVAPLTASDFYDGRVRGVFAAFLRLHQSGQPATVPDVIAAIGDLDAVGGVEFVQALSTHWPAKSRMIAWAKTVREKATTRRLLTALSEAQELVMGDGDLLIQAILNIVRNAAQALSQVGLIMMRTRVHRQVTIGHKRNRMAVKIDIEDNGPGIPPELMGQIFYPMVTGRAEGTGLGLSVAQSLINQHGGLIECTSEAGTTVFSVFLPLEMEHDARG